MNACDDIRGVIRALSKAYDGTIKVPLSKLQDQYKQPPKLFFKGGVFKNFTKFKGKHAG